MTPVLLEIRDAEGQVRTTGTGWFVRPGLVATALHVVGSVQPQGWAHEVPGQEGSQYRLASDGSPDRTLIPACYDAEADIALLRCDVAEGTDAVEHVLLAAAITTGESWSADGYPGFDKGDAWALSGKIVRLRGDRVQLLVEQGTDVSWQGVSGSAVLAGKRVVGLITAETSGTGTMWAASVGAIRRLVEAHDAMLAASELNDAITWDTDLDALRVLLGGLADGTHPELGAIRDRVEDLARPESVWNVPDSVLEDLQAFGLGPLREGFRPLVRQDIADTSIAYDAWDEFSGFFADSYRHDRFGGRAAELARLDRFVESSEGGYLFVTGPAGLGKTALMAEWLRCLRSRGERPCFHFITGQPTKLMQKPYTEGNCLQRVCAQLLHRYRLGGELPRETDRLRLLYARLVTLEPPPDERVIVILDGLDEALRDWIPSYGMFPAVAERVHVVFSARAVANRDWLDELRLDLPAERQIVMERLDRAEMREALERSGVTDSADDPDALLDVVAAVTEGDPDYLADVLALLLDTDADVDEVSTLPNKHSEYLLRWWDSAYEDLSQFGDAFDDLMGTLSVLREPIPADEIAQVSDEDQLNKGNIGVLIKRSARYLSGDPKDGYKLGRTRMLDMVADRLEHKIPQYQLRVMDYCDRWCDPTISASSRTYGLRNKVAHLLQNDRFNDAVDVVEPEWLATRWAADGSFAGLLEDLDRLVADVGAEVEVVEDPADLQVTVGDQTKLCRLPALAASRQTARELMAELPTTALHAWVALGGATSAFGLVDALGEHRGEAAQQLLAVADGLLASPAVDSELDVEATAARLIGRALSMLNLVRTSAWKLQRLEEMTATLTRRPLADEHMVRLVAQARAYADGCDEGLLRACAFGLVAQLAATSSRTRPAQDELLHAAAASAEGIESVSDRLHFWSCCLPAIRSLDPGRARGIADYLIRDLELPPDTSSLYTLTQRPDEQLFRAWGPEGDADIACAVELLGLLAECYLPHVTERFPDWIVEQLCELGFLDQARQLLDRISETSPTAAAVSRVAIATFLTDEEHGELVSSIETMGQELSDGRRGPLLVALGKRDAGLEIIDNVANGRKRVILECLDRLSRGAVPDEQAVDTIRELTNLAGSLDAEEAAEIEAEAARCLVTLDRSAAREYLERAMHRSLSTLPEGDFDTVIELWCLYRAREGRYDEAIDAVGRCTWSRNRIQTAASLLATIPDERDQSIDRLVELVADTCRTADDLLGEALLAACEAANVLLRDHPERARVINDAVAGRLTDLTINSGMVRCRLATNRIRRTLGDGSSDAELSDLIVWIRHVGADEIGLLAWEELCELVAERASEDEAELGQLQDLVERVGRDGKRIEYGARYAAVLAASDVEAGVDLLEQLTEQVEQLNSSEESSGALGAFRLMLAELGGGTTTEIGPWTSLLSALVRSEHAAPARTRPLMRRVFDSLLDQELALRDLARAAPGAFRALEGLGPASADFLNELVTEVFARLSELLDEAWFERAVLDTIDTFCANGQTDMATGLVTHLGAGSRQEAELAISMAVAAPDDQEKGTTPLDRSIARADENGWLARVRQQFDQEQSLAILVQIISDDASGLIPRRRLLSELGPFFVIVVEELWGLEGVELVVKSMLDADVVFTDAAERIATQV